MEAGLRNWIDRLDLHVHLVEPDGRARCDQRRRTARARSARNAQRRRPRTRRDPLPRPRRDHGRRRPVPRDLGRFRRRALVRAAPSPRAKRGALGRAARGGSHPGTSNPTGWTPSTCSGSRKGTSTSAQDTMPDDHPRSSGSGGRSRWTSPTSSASARSSGWTSCRSSGSSSGCGSTARRFAARPSRSTARSSDGSPRAPHPSPSAHSIGLGWLRAIDGVFPEDAAERRRRRPPSCRRRSTTPRERDFVPEITPADRRDRPVRRPMPPRSTRSSPPGTVPGCSRRLRTNGCSSCGPQLATDIARELRIGSPPSTPTPSSLDVSDGWAGLRLTGEDAARSLAYLIAARPAGRRRVRAGSTSRTSRPRFSATPTA